MQWSGKRKSVMSGNNNFLLDSNIIIRLSKQDEALSEWFNNNEDFAISIITYMEVLGYKFNDKREEYLVRKIISLMDVVYIDENIADCVIELRKLKKIKLPDAIIAATAIVSNMELATANVSDFKNIKTLKLLKI